MNIAELRAALEQARGRYDEARKTNDAAVATLRKLDGEFGDELDDEQRKQWDAADAEQRKTQAAVDEARKAEDAAREALAVAEDEQERSERADRVRDSRRKWRSLQLGNAPGHDRYARAREMVARGVHTPEWDSRQLVGEILRMAEGRVDGLTRADEQHFEAVLRKHLLADGDPDRDITATRKWGLSLAARCTPEYTRAFNAVMRHGWSAALTLGQEERAAIAVGTNTSGGFLVPLYLDPTVMLTSDGSANVVRQIARVVTLDPGQGNTWKGITSAGMTSSWDAEYAEVSDDSPAFAEPEVPLHTARTFAKATFQAVEDIPDLAGELLRLFADARDVAEGAAHCTGSGSGQPTGIVTALDANTNVEVVSTTAATLGAADVLGLLRDVPQRFRRRAQWLMHPDYADTIFALGTAVGASFTGTLADDLSPTLRGRPWHSSDDMPNTQTTTVRDNEIVVGDFGAFVIVDRPASMAVEYMANLTSQTTGGMPTGERGWLAWWRNGSDSVNDVAFRLLQDKTSA